MEEAWNISRNQFDDLIGKIERADRVGIRRKIVTVNRLKSALLLSIFERQEHIQNKYCIKNEKI